MGLDLLLRTSALLLVANLVTRLMIKAAPATRHLIWHISIVIVLFAPILTPLVPSFGVAMIQRTAEPQLMAAQAPLTSGTETAPDFLRTAAIAGSVIVGAWFTMGWVLSGWRVRRTTPAPAIWVAEANAAARKLGLTSPVEIRRFPEEGSPHVAGFLRSVVLLPASAQTWAAEDRQAAFVHELTHIRRGDRRTQALAQMACAVYWFNPLVWQAAAAIARERERACDAEVLRWGARPSAYATLLLDMARATRPAWTTSAALSMARPSAIEGRLLTILGASTRAPWRSSRWMVGTGALLLAGTVLGAQPSEQAVPAAAPRPQARLLDFDDHEQAVRITESLVGALGDANAQVREQAALGLAFTPGADVIDPLLTALQDSAGQVREKAAIGLAFRRDPRIVAPLINAMADHDSQVREKAAIALGASGDPRALEALQRAVHDPDSQVREKAVAGLMLLGLKK